MKISKVASPEFYKHDQITRASPSRTPYPSANPDPAGRFLSQEECRVLIERITAMAAKGGFTSVSIESEWRGNVRWARNQITTAGDTRNNAVTIGRMIRGAQGVTHVNQIDNTALEAAVRRAERLLIAYPETLEESLIEPSYMEPYTQPVLWFDRTFTLQAEERAEIMRQLIRPVEAAGMLAAGYIEVSASGRSVMLGDGKVHYYPFTCAQYSVTVRDPNGSASGWAGVDWNDWGRIDAEHISAVALDKCLRSQNPVAIEPGRYITILEPQAVCDLIASMFSVSVLDRASAEDWPPRGPYSGRERGWSKIGERIVDERITIGADPMDPECGFPPYSRVGVVFHPVTWIEHGVLKELAYPRSPYGIQTLGVNTGLPNSEAFRMQGGTATVDDMIANTRRGLLVTRFSNLDEIERESLLMTGVTRDGVWLIENGKISKAVKNLRFTDSPLFLLNNLLELGPAQRVFRPKAPAVVPPIKVQDMNFTSLADAV